LLLLIVGPKCTLAVSHAAIGVSPREYAPRTLSKLEKISDRQMDGRTDGQADRRQTVTR